MMGKSGNKIISWLAASWAMIHIHLPANVQGLKSAVPQIASKSSYTIQNLIKARKKSFKEINVRKN